MLNNRGFTLIEMMFVLSLTIIISNIGFFYHRATITQEDQLALVRSTFDLARIHAIVDKETVKVEVSSQEIMIHSNSFNKTVSLNDGYHFINNHSFSYNDSGHIKIAKRIILQAPKKKYAFVFQLGSGTYYVE